MLSRIYEETTNAMQMKTTEYRYKLAIIDIRHYRYVITNDKLVEKLSQ